MGVIYKATNNLNGNSYVGLTRNFESRKRQHISDSRNLNDKNRTVFHLALAKYGPDNFTWEILEECEDNVLSEREIYWIAYYDTYANGYNMTSGGEYNYDGLERYRQENPEKVLEHNRKCCEKMNQWRIEHPEENAAALQKCYEWKAQHKDFTRAVGLKSIKKLHQWQKEHPEVMKKVGQENIKKAQEATKKPVRCIEMDLVFACAKDAEEWSLSEENPNGKRAGRRHIGSVCLGKRNTCGGYHWEYINKEK